MSYVQVSKRQCLSVVVAPEDCYSQIFSTNSLKRIYEGVHFWKKGSNQTSVYYFAIVLPLLNEWFKKVSRKSHSMSTTEKLRSSLTVSGFALLFLDLEYVFDWQTFSEFYQFDIQKMS